MRNSHSTLTPSGGVEDHLVYCANIAVLNSEANTVTSKCIKTKYITYVLHSESNYQHTIRVITHPHQ